MLRGLDGGVKAGSCFLVVNNCEHCARENFVVMISFEHSACFVERFPLESQRDFSKDSAPIVLAFSVKRRKHE